MKRNFYGKAMVAIVISIVAIISILAPGEAQAGYPHASFGVEQSRLADELETREAMFSLHVDWVDLTLASNSTATLSHLTWSNSIAVYEREERGIFSYRIPVENISDVNGDWTCIIDDGVVSNQSLFFTVTNIETSLFPPFPSYPQLHYGGNYSNVFVAFESTINYGASLSAENAASSYPISGGRVYTYPEGGPYRVRLDYNTFFAPIPIYNAENGLEVLIEHPHLNSEIDTRFNISESAYELSLQSESDAKGYRVLYMGLATGETYRIRSSSNLHNWEDNTIFTSPGNAFLVEPDTTPTRQFYMIMK